MYESVKVYSPISVTRGRGVYISTKSLRNPRIPSEMKISRFPIRLCEFARQNKVRRIINLIKCKVNCIDVEYIIFRMFISTLYSE